MITDEEIMTRVAVEGRALWWLAYWINERENIRLRREAGLEVFWSPDYCMNSVRYCNVRREDDKVTRWLRQNWHAEDVPLWEFALTRFVNWVPTLRQLRNTVVHNPYSIRISLHNVPGRIWGNAYTVSTSGAKLDKPSYVQEVCVRLRKELGDFPKWTSLDEAYHDLRGVKGIGSFFAGQIIADIKNTKGTCLAAAEDWRTWSIHGPGSLRGLSYYTGHRVTAGAYHAALAQAWGEVQPLLTHAHLEDMHMQDFQNCMCEFSKFMRARYGRGPRNKYNPG